MAFCNEHFLELQGAYLFAEVRKRAEAYKKQHPDADIISLGIGDVTQPLAPAVVEAMTKAVAEMGRMETFRGYGLEQGYMFLRKAIAEGDFKSRGVDIDSSEIFVSDGAKCDTGNMQEIFSDTAIVAVTDPVYPVYVDSNVMAARGGKFVNGGYERIVYMPCYEECDFKASLPVHDPQIIYLCSPNNPKGAKDVAIEFRSYSKTAGFTGVRCGYCVVPHALKLETKSGEMVSANELWDRRQCTKFNGCSYIVQRGAEAIYTEEGRKQIQATLDIYRNNARVILEGVKEAGLHAIGGTNSPYIWLSVPEGMTSWQFFDFLLDKAGIICTPGSGFGSCGEGYVRLTSFNTPELTRTAVERMKKALKEIK